LDLKQKLTQENENLQKELKSANDKIHSMREEMDNHLQKLMKLTIANEAKVIPSSTKTVFINTIYSIFN
jgi:chromosome segregation ATPase